MPTLTTNPDTDLPYRTESPQPNDPELIATVVDGYERGLGQRAIAANARMGRTTLDQWIRDGQIELNAYHAGETETLGSYGLFYSYIERAYAQFEGRKVDKIEAAGPDWVAALAHVTRRNPGEWAEKRQIQIESTSVVVHATLPQLAEQQLLALVKDKLDSGVKLLPPPPN